MQRGNCIFNIIYTHHPVYSNITSKSAEFTKKNDLFLILPKNHLSYLLLLNHTVNTLVVGLHKFDFLTEPIKKKDKFDNLRNHSIIFFVIDEPNKKNDKCDNLR